MKNIRSIFSFLILLFSIPALACTAFEFGTPTGGGGLAHNFDWYKGMPYTTAFFINARNVTKSGVDPIDSSSVATWTSKYGSVTYSLLGRGFPVGGQNEKGLVIHIQQNVKSKYPSGSLPTLEAGQYAQLLLDTAADVPEALAQAATVRPWSSLDLHYFLCDANGTCAVIEFLNGEMKTYSGKDLPVLALTNNDYPSSVSAWNSCEASGKACSSQDNSLQRFMQAAGFSANYTADQAPLDYALSSLNTVAQTAGPFTRFHFFSPQAAVGKLYFAGYGQTAWQSLDMSKIDFSCASDGNWFEIDVTASGDQTKAFQAYTEAEQKKLVSQLPLPSDWAALYVGYPATMVCK